MRYALYRLYGDEDVLLYVGMSMNLPGRLTQHRTQKAWWVSVRHIAVEHFDDRHAVLAAERAAIESERPLWNIQYNTLAVMPTSPYEQAVSMLYGGLPGFEDSERRAELAAYFEWAHADDEDEGGNAPSFADWPQELKAAVAAVEKLAEREWYAVSTIYAALMHLTGGDPATAIAEARVELAEHGEEHPSDEDLERRALRAVAERIAESRSV